MKEYKTSSVSNPPRLLWMPLPLALPVLYLIFGVLWIPASDHMIEGLAVSEAQLRIFSVVKGWFFIVVSALLLYLVLLWNARKTAEQQKRVVESEQHLKIAQSAARLGSWEQDGQTEKLTWSDTVYELFGMDPKTTQPSVELFFQRVHPEDQEQVGQAFAASLEPGAPPYDLTHRVIRADTGEVRDVHEHSVHLRDAEGNVIKSIGTVQDITEFKKAEQALERSRKLMADVVDSVPDLMWLKDKDGIYLFCNPRFERLFGADKEAIVGRSDLDFMPVEQAAFFRKHDQLAVEKGGPSINEEAVVFIDDGHRETLETIKTPMYHPDGSLLGVLGIGRDITGRKQAETELELNRKLLSDVINAIPDMVWMKDIDGTFLTCNREFEKLAGKSQAELIGTTDYDHFNKEQADICCEQDTNAIKNGVPSTHVEPMAHATMGGDIWYEVIKTPVCDNEGQPLGVLGVGRDITGRKQAEQTLAESEEKYRALFNNAPLSYQSLNEDGCFLDVNPAWLRTLGYERDEVIGNWFGDFLHPDFVQHFETNFPAFKKRGYVKDVHFRIRHKNGTYRHIEFEGCIGYLPDGSFRQTYCVFMDITERKVAEEQLAASEERFRMICENAPVLINGFDEEGHCSLWNEQCRKTFGWTIEEIKTQDDALALFYPDPTVHDEVLQTITSDPDGQFREWNPKTRDGRELTTIWANVRLPNGQVYSMGYDITAQRKAEQARRESEQWLLRAQKAAHIGTWSINLMADTMQLSEESGRILGLAAGTYPKEEVFAAVPPEDLPAINRATEITLNGGAPYSVEHRLIHQNTGTVTWVDSRGELACDDDGTARLFVGTVLDITERKQAEEELVKNRDQLEERVDERTQELRQIVNAMAGRENRMAELKEVVESLKAQLSKAGVEPLDARDLT